MLKYWPNRVKNRVNGWIMAGCFLALSSVYASPEPFMISMKPRLFEGERVSINVQGTADYLNRKGRVGGALKYDGAPYGVRLQVALDNAPYFSDTPLVGALSFQHALCSERKRPVSSTFNVLMRRSSFDQKIINQFCLSVSLGKHLEVGKQCVFAWTTFGGSSPFEIDSNDALVASAPRALAGVGLDIPFRVAIFSLFLEGNISSLTKIEEQLCAKTSINVPRSFGGLEVFALVDSTSWKGKALFPFPLLGFELKIFPAIARR